MLGLPFPEDTAEAVPIPLAYALAVMEIARIDASVAINSRRTSRWGASPFYLFGTEGAKGGVPDPSWPAASSCGFGLTGPAPAPSPPRCGRGPNCARANGSSTAPKPSLPTAGRRFTGGTTNHRGDRVTAPDGPQ